MSDEKLPRKTRNAKVYVRFLPNVNFCYDSIKIGSDKKTVHVQCLQDFSKSRLPSQRDKTHFWCFPTDGVFWNACQDEVYDTATAGLVPALLSGTSAVVVSYGQTGSGKTFTTSGLCFHYENRGIILRIVTELFEERTKRKLSQRISYRMSYVEVLGEDIRDLLCSDYFAPPLHKDNLVQRPEVVDEADCWERIFDAETRKLFDCGAPYVGANRGHSVLTIYVEGESLLDTDPVIVHSKLHMVDLGGVDNYGQSSSYWRSSKDVGASNLGKTFMEQLVLCLRRKTLKCPETCPQKFNRIIEFLLDSLKPSCLLRFIAHVHGNFDNLALTLSVLRFGQQLKRLPPTKVAKEAEPSCYLSIQALEREVARLKDELCLNEMLQDVPNYANISQDKLHEIARAAEGYLLQQLSNLTLVSLGQANLTLEVFRNKYQQLLADKEEAVREAIQRTREDMMELVDQAKFSDPLLQPPEAPSKQRVNKRSSSVSTDSSTQQGPPVRQPATVTGAGQTDRKGIGLGKGKSTNNFEGNVTKVLRKSGSKNTGSTVRMTKRTASTHEKGTMPFAAGIDKTESQLSVPTNIPPRDTAWTAFSEDMKDVVDDAAGVISKLEEDARSARKRHLALLTEMADIRTTLDKKRSDLSDHRHIRSIYGREDEDVVGMGMAASIEEHVKLLDEKVERSHLALEELKTCTEALSLEKARLEAHFQGYCLDKYNTAMEEEEERLASTVPSESTSTDSITSHQAAETARTELFFLLQRAMFQTVYLPPKKQWKE